MSEIPKAYEPQAVEEKWYQFWLDRNCFTANPHSAKPAYSIVIPPPNVTGVLTPGARAQQHHPGHPGAARRAWRATKCSGCPARTTPASPRRRWWSARLKKSGEIKHRDDLGREKFLETRLGMEGKARRHHHPATQEARRVVRLDARAIHDGPGVFALRAEGFCRALQKGADLSRQTHGELVSRLADRAVRRRSGDEGAERASSIISKSKSPRSRELF